jgi:hypothetical protein
MLRAALTGLLWFCLLFMQQEDMRHALGHIGAQLQRAEHSALELPTGDTCAECALLAAGAGSITATALTHDAAAPAWVAVVAPVARASAAHASYYQSRAPPAVLQHA